MTGPRISLQPASTLAIDALADAFTRAFEGYMVPVALDGAGLAQMIAAEQFDVAESVVAVEGDVPLGVLLSGRRGHTLRIGAMAVRRAARGGGIGRRMLEHALANRGGADRVVLEVIRGNEPACRLYERAGFRTERVLCGYRGTWNGVQPDPPDAAELEPCDPWDVRASPSPAPPTPATWQLDGRHPWCAASDRGFVFGPARCVVSVGGTGVNVIRWIAVDPAHQGRGWATACLGRVMGACARKGAAEHGATWRVPEVVPEEWPCAVFEKMGLERSPLEQFEMVRRFDGATFGRKL